MERYLTLAGTDDIPKELQNTIIYNSIASNETIIAWLKYPNFMSIEELATTIAHNRKSCLDRFFPNGGVPDCRDMD